MVRSIEPLVVRVEGGDGDVEDLHPADGAVAAAGFDENRRQRFHREALAVEFDEAFALHFEDRINLGHLLVIVGLRIELDIDDVHGGDGVVGCRKTPARETARAAHRRHFVELADHVVFLRGDGGGGRRAHGGGASGKQCRATTPASA